MRVGYKERQRKDRTWIYTAKISELDGRSARKQFVSCFGLWAVPYMRRFHGKDVRGCWSVTEVDPKKDITIIHKTHMKENKTPLGVRIEEREMLLVNFSMTTNVYKHDDIFNKMQEEEIAADENPRSAFLFSNQITKEYMMVKELAERRRVALRSAEKRMNFLEGRNERLQANILELREQLRDIRDAAP